MTACESWNAKIAVGVVWTRLLIKRLLISDCCWGEWLWFRMWFWFRLIPYVSVWKLHAHLNSSHTLDHSHLTAHTLTHKQTNNLQHTTPHTLKWWPRRDSQDGQAFNMYFMYVMFNYWYVLAIFLIQFLSNVHAYFNYRPSEVNTASVLRGDYCSDLHIHYMHSLNCSKIVDHSPHALCMPSTRFDLVLATCQTLDSHSLVWRIIVYTPVPIFGKFFQPAQTSQGWAAESALMFFFMCFVYTPGYFTPR